MECVVQLPGWLPRCTFGGCRTRKGAQASLGSHSLETNWNSEKPRLLGLEGQSTQEDGAAHKERESQRSAKRLPLVFGYYARVD